MGAGFGVACKEKKKALMGSILNLESKDKEMMEIKGTGKIDRVGEGDQ